MENSMFYSFLRLIKEIAVFMVICKTLLHFMPTKNYAKYIKPIIAFMILSKILVSILVLNTSDIKISMEDTMIKYEKQLQAIEVAEMANADIDVTEQVKEKLNEDIINKYIVKNAVIKKGYISEEEKCILEITLYRKDKKITVENVDLKNDSSEEENQMIHIIAESLGAEEENIKVVMKS